MNNGERNNVDNREEIDLVDFSSNREMDRIRENERIEREKRRKRAAQIRRAEILKQRKKRRIQQTVVAWGIIVLAVLAVVALIIGVVSLFNDDEEEPVMLIGSETAAEQTALVNAFVESSDVIYSSEGENGFASLIKNYVLTDDVKLNSTSQLSMYAKAYMWNKDLSNIEKLKEAVRDVPMLNNGYVWSSADSMRSSQSNSYYYDTHAGFITAACEICLWEGSTAFLNETDPNAVDNKDVSIGKTVRQKLENAVNYYFDNSDPYGGGIRYNDEDGLVYIKTAGNDGTPQGSASNVFFTYKFGYLDCYNNLLFNEAMTSLSNMYKMAGDEESSQKYADIAEKNKKAVNDTFYDNSKGRFVGYIDIDGAKYDYGFTGVNLLAVSLGICDETRTQSIMSWIDGERKVAGDSVDSKQISAKVLPLFSCVEADDSTWNTIGGKFLTSDNASFGNFWLNGGKSALCGYYELMARKALGDAELKKCVNELSNAAIDGLVELPEDSETAEPKIYYSLLASSAVKSAFGVSTEGKMLTVAPVFGHKKNVGIKNISFADKNYSFLFDNGAVYVLCDVANKDMLRIGGFSKKEELVLTIVKDGKIEDVHETKADKNGNLIVTESFGENTYIKIEEKITEEK